MRHCNRAGVEPIRSKHFALSILFNFIAAVLLWALVAWPHERADAQSKPPQVDRIVIVKSARELTLMSGGKTLKTYKVALGTQPVGAKERQGDHKTPEGNYVIDAKIPNSQFHHALHISYPSAADRVRAWKLGASPGGDVEIHGLGAKYAWVGARHRLVDWTDGCVAVTNEEIDEIYPLVPVGTPVEIRP